MEVIDLENTVFDPSQVIEDLPTTLEFKGGTPGKTDQLRPFRDLGTVFIGNIPKEDKDMSLPQKGAPVFTAPEHWRMPQLLRALGAFKSATAASKNGWDMDIPEGISHFLVKIRKVKSEIWIHKNTTK